MRLPDDDELYDVDQTYLGPPGRYIGVMRHKTIFAALVILPLLFVAARRIGVPMTLMTVGLLLLAGVGLAMTIADRTSQERSIAALLTSVWHDLSARRAPATTTRHAGGADLAALRAPRRRRGRGSRRSTTADASTRPSRHLPTTHATD